MPDARVPPLASAMRWNSLWCSITPSSVTHSRSLRTESLVRLHRESAASAVCPTNVSPAVARPSEARAVRMR